MNIAQLSFSIGIFFAFIVIGSPKATAAPGELTTVAGKGVSGNSGDGGLATDAELVPRGLAIDEDGN